MSERELDVTRSGWGVGADGDAGQETDLFWGPPMTFETTLAA